MRSSPSSADKSAPKAKGTGAPDNPKTDREPVGNRIKDPEEWVSGHEPMTEAQASYLKTLSEQAHDPDAYDPQLDKAEASKRIDRLKQEKDG